MESMRALLKRSLGNSLSAMSATDRLAAAWPVAAGISLAKRGSVCEFVDGVLSIEVQDAVWLDQLSSMRQMFQHELSRIAEVQVVEIHFVLKSSRVKGL